MWDQDQVALVGVDPIHLDPEVFFREAGLHALRPFHYQHAVCEYAIEVENGAVERVFRLQAVSIAVKKHVTTRPGVFVDNHIRGAGDFAGGPPALGDALYQRGLTGAKVAFEADDVSNLEQAAKTNAHPAGLLRAMRKDFKSMRWKYWHLNKRLYLSIS